METLSALLFELANIDRLNILIELRTNAKKLTNIAKKLELTVQETSRHLQRLCDAHLLMKHPDGAYHITAFGENVLELLPGLDFLTKHREYFVTHSLNHLPKEFLSRIGDLQDSILLDSPVLAFQWVNTIIEGANRQLYLVADQVPSGSIPLIEAAVKRGVITYFLMPEDLESPILPASYIPHYDTDDRMRMSLGRAKSVNFVGVISEKAAVVGFPTIDSTMDYLAFYSENEAAVYWCRDLFLHFWDQVEPVHPADE
ncbi:MAG: helix-turn-helix transcriptional regulator [Candidatus Thorarchaeota archaeon]